LIEATGRLPALSGAGAARATDVSVWVALMPWAVATCCRPVVGLRSALGSIGDAMTSFGSPRKTAGAQPGAPPAHQPAPTKLSAAEGLEPPAPLLSAGTEMGRAAEGDPAGDYLPPSLRRRAGSASAGPGARPSDVTMFCRALACIQLACAVVAILWVIVYSPSTVNAVATLGLAVGGVVFWSVLLRVASRIGRRWLPLVALVSTSWLAGYAYFGGETAATFGMFVLVSAAVVVWYLPDRAAVAQVAWMVCVFWIALWVRVYPGEHPWPHVYIADVDTTLVWGAALCTAPR
jgi:hypothetical protein